MKKKVKVLEYNNKYDKPKNKNNNSQVINKNKGDNNEQAEKEPKEININAQVIINSINPFKDDQLIKEIPDINNDIK